MQTTFPILYHPTNILYCSLHYTTVYVEHAGVSSKGHTVGSTGQRPDIGRYHTVIHTVYDDVVLGRDYKSSGSLRILRIKDLEKTAVPRIYLFIFLSVFMLVSPPPDPLAAPPSECM